MHGRIAVLVAGLADLLQVHHAEAFECSGCISQTFVTSGTLDNVQGTVFALAVGGGAGGAKLGGGASGVVASGVIELVDGTSHPVRVGIGGTGFDMGGTRGYNGGDNNLNDDVAATVIDNCQQVYKAL